MFTKMQFSYKQSCLLSHDQLLQEGDRVRVEIDNVRSLLPTNKNVCAYKTPYSFIESLYDVAMHEHVKQLAQAKRELKPTLLVVIGIGGSNLGTKAVYEALYGLFPDSDVQVYFADTVDADYIHGIAQSVEKVLKAGENVLLNVISKSGTTIETVVNFELLLSLLKEYKGNDYAQYVVVTTDEGSELWNFGMKNNMDCLPIAELIGGRYSVFSPVGLFPLACVGIDIGDLISGASDSMSSCLDTNIVQNMAVISALILYIHYRQNIFIHDTFLFSVDCASIGAWYRQLMGESIGKEYDISGKRVSVGITPTVSVGSIDLHSVAQLYLGGPQDKMTTFVSVKNNRSNVVIPSDSFAKDFLQNRSLSHIMDAILQGTKRAYADKKRPFVSITLPDKSAYSIGQFMQMKMMEMIYLGYLLHVNPFDQPNVQAYKKETIRLLKSM